MVVVYDGRGHHSSTVSMLSHHGISRKEYVFWKKQYPNLSNRDLIDLIKSKKGSSK